jgi:hypothetical protein
MQQTKTDRSARYHRDFTQTRPVFLAVRAFSSVRGFGESGGIAHEGLGSAETHRAGARQTRGNDSERLQGGERRPGIACKYRNGLPRSNLSQLQRNR